AVVGVVVLAAGVAVDEEVLDPRDALGDGVVEVVLIAEVEVGAVDVVGALAVEADVLVGDAELVSDAARVIPRKTTLVWPAIALSCTISDAVSAPAGTALPMTTRRP